MSTLERACRLELQARIHFMSQTYLNFSESGFISGFRYFPKMTNISDSDDCLENFQKPYLG